MKDKNLNCVFAGSFDPVTIGHIDIIDKCLDRYNNVLVVIGENAKKACLFNIIERKAMLEKIYKGEKRVKIIAYQDIASDYANYLKVNDYSVYARGIRNDIDLEYEKGFIEQNKTIYPFIQTVFISAEEKYKEISSNLVKSLILEKKDYSGLVPKEILNDIKEYILQKNL